MAERRLERDRPALGEAGQHDPAGRNAGLDLPRDQPLDGHLRLAEMILVGDEFVAVHPDVVPGSHRHSEIDGNRAEGGVWENETGPRAQGAELGNEGREVVTVRTEPVQPDDGARGPAVPRLVDDRWFLHGRHVEAIARAVQRCGRTPSSDAGHGLRTSACRERPAWLSTRGVAGESRTKEANMRRQERRPGTPGAALVLVAASAAMLLALGGCGQSGPLHLPEKSSLSAALWTPGLAAGGVARPGADRASGGPVARG